MVRGFSLSSDVIRIWIGFLGMRSEDEAAQIEEKEEEREKEFVEVRS